MNNKVKLARYEETIRQVVNNALAKEVNNKYAKFASVTYVKLTNDLTYANIYIDCLKRNDINKVIDNLNIVKGFIRSKVNDALNLYKAPQIIFLADQTIDYVNKIESLLDQINKKDKNEIN